MNFKSYGWRMVIFVIAAGVTLIAAATTWAASADNVDAGTERDRVAAAATKAAGGGTATDVEHSDEVNGAYEVEVRKPNGTEVDVVLDKSLQVLGREDDGADDDLDADDSDADDRTLTKAEQAKVADAATRAVGSGRVTDMEASDDLGTAYEAEVRDRAGAEWDVELDAKFAVVSKSRDS